MERISRKTGKNINCEICKKEFYVKQCQLSKNKKFCSITCKAVSQKSKPTWNKGLTKETDKRIDYERPSCKKGKPAPSTAFKKGHIPANKGLGNKTPHNHKMRMRLEYKDWHKKCLEKDNFTCQKTGKRGGILEVHHILNYAQHPELRLEVFNGITLSKESHRLFHKTYGQTNNTKEQLEQFIGKSFDGTMNTLTITYPATTPIVKTFNWLSGVLQSITVT